MTNCIFLVRVVCVRNSGNRLIQLNVCVYTLIHGFQLNLLRIYSILEMFRKNFNVGTRIIKTIISRVHLPGI